MAIFQRFYLLLQKNNPSAQQRAANSLQKTERTDG